MNGELHMGYLSAWKVLEEMIADFRKKGALIPQEIINELKSAKTLINVLKADSSCIETRQRIEEHLLKVESYLSTEGQKKFGANYVEEWLRRLDEASGKMFEEETEEIRFIPGVPREQKWIRVKPSEDMPIEKLKALAEESALSYNVQNDDYLLVYGEDKQIKEFIRKMAVAHETKSKK